METLRFDLSKKLDKFKIMNATNGGPWHKRHANDQYRSNFDAYKAARIPYSRTHDSGGCYAYGAPYSYDIHAIFPNFDADVNDPASYDFACTDESILTTLDAGTKTYFRLGETIEHHIKKHATLPPKDFQKWAEICEHVIRHYTEGWADGLNLDIEYWEIWNEPDLDPDDAANKRCWGGTKAQFFEFYATAAKHLKSKFPHLKIGGPALAGGFSDHGQIWAGDFLRYMKAHDVPIDFVSWHIYSTSPDKIASRCYNADRMLKELGYGDAENILNEYNYIRGWEADFKYSIMAIHGLKNASFILATMAACHPTPLDMLMYYDTRPSSFCGIFDLYSYDPLKGYYPMMWYGKFYDLENEVRSENKLDGIYSLAGTDKDGKVLCMLTHYDENDDAEAKEITLDFGREGKYEIYVVDNDSDGELKEVTSDLTLKLPVHTCVLIKEV